MSNTNNVVDASRAKVSLLTQAVSKALGGHVKALDIGYKSNRKIIESMDALCLEVGIDWTNEKYSTTTKEYKADVNLALVVDLGIKAQGLHMAWAIAKGKTEAQAKNAAKKWWLGLRKESDAFNWVPSNSGDTTGQDVREKIQKHLEKAYELFCEIQGKNEIDQKFIAELKSYAGIE